MNKKISVIIPFFYSNNLIDNRVFELKSFDKCLAAIFQTKYNNYEVILVSDNSSLESINIAEKYKIKLIKSKTNRGAAHARNLGASKAKGKILLFLDSDVLIKKNALSIINNYFNNKNNKGGLQGVYSHKHNYKSSISQYLTSYHCYYLFTETKKNKFTDSLCTAFFSIKNELFKKHKGFDTNFKKAGNEDVDFGYKIINDNNKIEIDRRLECIHRVNFGIISFIKRTLRLHTEEMKMYLRNKSINKKINQSNYSTVIIGIVLIFLIIAASLLNKFYPITYYKFFLWISNFIFIIIHLRFLNFIYKSKGILISLKSILYLYLHRFLFIVCFFYGIISFYLFKKKY